MRLTRSARGLPSVLCLVLTACGASTQGTSNTTPSPTAMPADVVGVTTRADIEAAAPAWREAIAAAEPAEETARALAHVPPGAEVDVFLGTWCGDSRREVSRLFAALAIAEREGPLPFTMRLIGVDRAKVAPGLTDGAELRWVPTIIVRRGGVEQGRMIETATLGVERDLLDLLTGTRTGVLSLTRSP